MVTAIVRSKLATGVDREAVLAQFRASLGTYQGVDGLLRKSFILDADGDSAGGVYLWASREAADAFFSPAWKERMGALYGSAPEIMIFDTHMIVDNEADEVLFVGD